MALIQVHSPGLRTLVQDLGRPGWAHFGISASGAAVRTVRRKRSTLSASWYVGMQTSVRMTGEATCQSGAVGHSPSAVLRR